MANFFSPSQNCIDLFIILGADIRDGQHLARRGLFSRQRLMGSLCQQVEPPLLCLQFSDGLEEKVQDRNQLPVVLRS